MDEILEVQEDKLALQKRGYTTMHLEVQEDKLDFQGITGRVFILLLICLPLFTLQGQYMIGILHNSLSISHEAKSGSSLLH